jgi:hypothetical protein
MPNPFAGLQPALEVMAREGEILPATGQAVEDLMRIDQEEAYDRVRLGLQPGDILELVMETPNRELYVECPPIVRQEKHLLRYFLDGSARTFYLGNVVEGEDRQTPIHISQIGAAAVLRDDNGRMKLARAEHKLVLLMKKEVVSFGSQVEDAIRTAGPKYEFVDLTEDDPQTQGVQAGKEPRSRAAHKANWRMRELERVIAVGLKRKPGEWLVLDGGLGSEYVKQPLDSLEYIGVVKSSWKELKFSVKSGRSKQTINTYRLLASLKAGQRTLAFGLREGRIATWFVRIRGPEHLEFPLMGVLRVELPNPSGEAVSSQLITELSGALVAERCVSPHGKDVRWHAHLYAVYLAEQAVKNGFVSTEVLKAGIKWPTPANAAMPL